MNSGDEEFASLRVLDVLVRDRVRILDQLKHSDLMRYDYLQSQLRKTDVTTDMFYQSNFNSFYVVRRGGDWTKGFFSILEREKNNDLISLDEVLKELYRTARHAGRQQVETSFSSKLVATIRPELPVYDSRVRKSLGLATPFGIKQSIEVYSELRKQTLEITQHAGFNQLGTCFDVKFPRYKHFTDIKKLDLFLWENRN